MTLFGTQRFHSPHAAAWLLASAACVAALGCHVEQNPPRSQVAMQKDLRAQSDAITPRVGRVDPAGVDQAGTVLQACGQPASDTGRYIYNDEFHGPVRQIEYSAPRAVRLYFIPANAPVRALPEGTDPRPAPGMPIPQNVPWAFVKATAGPETLLTAARVGVALPCAGSALARYE